MNGDRLTTRYGKPRRWVRCDVTDSGTNCVVTDDTDQFIVVGTHAKLSREEADLVAAAPELLEALEAAVAIWPEGLGVADAFLTLAKHAIAKATAHRSDQRVPDVPRPDPESDSAHPVNTFSPPSSGGSSKGGA